MRGLPTQTVNWTFEEDEVVVSFVLDTGLPGWWGDEFRGPVADSISVTVDGKRAPHEYDASTRTVTARYRRPPELPHEVRVYHENVFKNRNIYGRLMFTSGEESDRAAEEPMAATRPAWKDDALMKSLPTASTPIVLLEGGATAESQAVLDAIEMPSGSALTIASIDRVGGIRAIRWRDSGDVGFYPASTVKLATALMTLRQVAGLDGEATFSDWSVSLDGSRAGSRRDVAAGHDRRQ